MVIFEWRKIQFSYWLSLYLFNHVMHHAEDATLVGALELTSGHLSIPSGESDSEIG